VTRHIVAHVSELGPGARLIVALGRRSIGVYNVDGNYFAIRNRCPHQGGPLCLGTTSGLHTARFTDGDPPAVVMEREGEIVKCPWHGWQFDMRTGEAIFGERVRVATYKAYRSEEANESVAVDDVAVPDNVETYRTVVEDDYVVVEIPVGGAGRARE
jgi:nitrite reductase (NADH) small subunit